MPVADKYVIEAAVMALLDADDATLDMVEKIIHARRVSIRAIRNIQLSTEIAVGDYRILRGLSTKYLNGCEVKVLEYLAPEKVLVEVYSISGSDRQPLAEKKRLHWKQFTVPLSVLHEE